MTTSKRRILGRLDILGARDMETEEVKVPQWGGSVLVRSLTAAERDHLEAGMVVGRGRRRDLNLENFRSKLVAAAVVDEEGNRLFTEADVEALSQKSAGALDKIVGVAQRLSGITAEDVEELTKNSPAPPGDSPSD